MSLASVERPQDLPGLKPVAKIPHQIGILRAPEVKHGVPTELRFVTGSASSVELTSTDAPDGTGYFDQPNSGSGDAKGALFFKNEILLCRTTSVNVYTWPGRVVLYFYEAGGAFTGMFTGDFEGELSLNGRSGSFKFIK